MAKLTYEEMMKIVQEKLTDKVINEVIQEMGIEDDVIILDDELIAHQDSTHSVSYSTVNNSSSVGLNLEGNTLKSLNTLYDIEVKNNSHNYEENKIRGKDYFKVSA